MLRGDEHHVAADDGAEGEFDEAGAGEVVQVGDLLSILAGEWVAGKEAEEGTGVAVAEIVLTTAGLVQGLAGMDAAVGVVRRPAIKRKGADAAGRSDNFRDS